MIPYKGITFFMHISMYFLQQLTQQFSFCIFAQMAESTSTVPQVDLSEPIDTLDKAKTHIDALQAEEGIRGTELKVILSFLEKIAAGKIEGLSKDDPEFKELYEKSQLKIAKYADISRDAGQVAQIMKPNISADGKVTIPESPEIEGQQQDDHIARFELQNVENYVDAKILERGERNAEIENRATEEKNKRRTEFEAEYVKLSEEPTQEQLKVLAESFGAKGLHDWIEDLEDTPEDATQKEKLQKLLASLDSREFTDIPNISEIEAREFIWKVKQEDRLAYFTSNGELAKDIQTGQSLEMTFTYEWISNSQLETLTAGQILPDTVQTVKVEGKEYHRRGLLGEFYTKAEDGTLSERLFIRESESIEIGTVRTADEVKQARDDIVKQTESSPENTRDLQIASLERWLWELDSSTIQALEGLIPWIGEEGRPAAVESRITDIAESVGNTTALDLEWLKSDGLLWAILAMLIEFMQWSKDSNGNSIWGLAGNSSLADIAGAIGLTPEQQEQFGETGTQLSMWLAKSGYPAFNGQPNYCGQNVGMALNAFGIKGLPDGWRHGYRWAEICASRPSQFKKVTKECTPQTAPAWAIISYDKGTGWSDARQQYGHVEIACGNNTWYYFGKKANNPGWSNPGFKRGSYEIYVPIKKWRA